MDVSNGFAEFVESFDGDLSALSEFFKEFVSELPESVLVHP